MMSGPFAYLDPENDASSSQPNHHDREVENHFLDGWGADIPLNVGKRAKAKEKSRREKRAREQAACDRDDDDWFDRAKRKDKTRNIKKPARDEKRHNPGLSVKGASRNHRPSLLDRISDIPHSGGRHKDPSSVSGKSGRTSRKEPDYHGTRESDSDRDWKGRYDGIPTGPRYRGGYSR
jgi:protein AIR1/2